MKRDRRTFLQSIGIAGVAGLAGCIVEDDGGDGSGDGGDGSGDGGDGSGDGDDGSDGGDGTDTDTGGGDGTDEDTPTATAEPVNVGMVYALGGLGDTSFNDMAHEGIQQAADEMPVEFDNAEPERDEDFDTLQRRFAQETNPDYDLVSCIGFAQTTDLVNNAPQFEDQNFMLVDSTAETEDGDLIENVANYEFDEHQGSFLVGQLAAMLTNREFDAGAGETNDDTVLGFVGGLEIPLIKKFEAGYRAGVQHVDENIEVRAAYTGSWTDPAAGQEIALSMYDEGADIVYHGAGASGVGVFQAAQQEGRYAIGVDADQSRSSPEHSDVIVASMVKRVDTAVYNAVESVVNDEFEGGAVNALGLSDDGIEAVVGQDFEDAMPSDVTDAVAESRQAIIDGDIEVPTDPDDL